MQAIRRRLQDNVILAISTGVILRMLLSLEPVISQLSIESQRAMPWRSKRERLSSIVSGRSSPVSAAISGQKRLRGCP